MKKKIKIEDLRVSPELAHSGSTNVLPETNEGNVVANTGIGVGTCVTEKGEETCKAECMKTVNATCDSGCWLTKDATCDAECKTVIEGYTCKCDGEGDGKSQQDGTGSLCISVVLCMPTEKNCEMSQKVCQELTKQAGCKETVNYCVSAACIDPSFNYCLVSEQICPESEACQETRRDCIITGDCGETEFTCQVSGDCAETEYTCIRTVNCGETDLCAQSVVDECEKTEVCLETHNLDCQP